MNITTAPSQFTEDFKWQRQILFDHESYNKWVEKTMPMVKKMKAGDKIEVGNKQFTIKEFPMWDEVPQTYGMPFIPAFLTTKTYTKRMGLEIYKGRTTGHAYFTGPVNIPVLYNHANVWMSLTPNEVLTQRGSIRRTRGRVGVAGLGLGWAVAKILDRPKVDFVTVVENDSGVIKMFGKPLKAKYGSRLQIVEASAYDHDWTQYDVSFWDIWQGMDDAIYDSKFDRIKTKVEEHGKVCVYWGVKS